MFINVAGRVSNVHLSRGKPLLPVFEAIVNSLDAIEDVPDETNGRIAIHVERDKSQGRIMDDDTMSYPIAGFIVEDNGIGFDNNNFIAFKTSDTPYKKYKGGKGIGRFLWLKAFDSVRIESVFREESEYRERKFDFILSEAGVEGGEETMPTGDKNRITRVHMRGFKKEYEENCPRKQTTIAHRIIEHFLSSFMSGRCPNILLIDDAATIDLNELFQQEYRANSTQCAFAAGDEAFELASLRYRSSDPQNHRMHYCANNRAVISEPLRDAIPDLAHKITDEDGDPFAYVAFVSGRYLDANVNAERTDFNIIKEATPLLQGYITFDAIRDSALNEVKLQLHPFLLPIREKKIDRIRRFVQEQAPQYRHILKYEREPLEFVDPDISDDSLELELHKLHQRLELTVKEQSKEFLNLKIADIRQYPEYKEKYLSFCERLNDVGKANLAKYIIHRKIILDLFENSLSASDEGYGIEESVHQIIFPPRTTSDDITYEDQNLWILDEKLAYHFFLASDKKLSQIEYVNVNSDSRPDLLVFNNPGAFVDQSSDFSSVVIIEFKRPMRKDYSGESENPIVQVYDYVRELRNGHKLDKNGRPVMINQNTPFYAYIVCDVTSKVRKYAEDAGLIETPDSQGYFGFNKNLQTYIEVLSYNKVLADSQKRNRVLFDQLNIS